MKRVNPFRPNSPVNPAMFVGRLAEVNKLEIALIQTRSGNPTHFIITGERGIGKSSLSLYLRYVAQGNVEIFKERVNFLVLDTDINKSTTQLGLLKKIQGELSRQLAKSEPAKKFLSDAWDFLTRLQIGGFKIDEKTTQIDDELLLDEFVSSLSKTIERVCSENDALTSFGQKYDGILLLIDEADSSSQALDIGTLLKQLLEKLQRIDCNKLLIGLIGLPEIREILIKSHPSSLRIFEELVLDRLNEDEVGRVLDTCIKSANQENPRKTLIDPKAKDFLIKLSEGYPHFIQQFGYCAMAEDQDGLIDYNDVMKGAVGPGRGLELIGDKYYRNDFYKRIQTKNYRKILQIMAEQLDSWVKRSDIKMKFDGDEGTLNNALKALKDRHIIIPKEGEPGTYRLQHKGFALWIKLYTEEGIAEIKK